MKLVLYSGYAAANDPIDRAALRLTGKRNPRFVFIPSANHVPEFEYEYVKDTYGVLGVTNIAQLNLDRPYSLSDAEKIIKSADIIYLSGGNTFYFLKSIRRNHFDKLLLKFVQKGGVLAGLSAGAIIMTPTIATASYPKFDRDENTVGIRNLDALSLVNFDFFPHYNHEPEYARELRKQSTLIKRPIYGVSDGGGIVVEQNRLSFFGNVWGHVDGKQFDVHVTLTKKRSKKL
jgi:dipeptidase E